MSGPQLKAQREALRPKVTQAMLAEKMGVGRPFVSQTEGRAAVSEATSSRYLAALIACASEKRTVS